MERGQQRENQHCQRDENRQQQQQQQHQQQQQQQNHLHHHHHQRYRPPDVEEALSSMLWTPYERTPTDSSSSSDEDEKLNSKLIRKPVNNNLNLTTYFNRIVSSNSINSNFPTTTTLSTTSSSSVQSASVASNRNSLIQYVPSIYRTKTLDRYENFYENGNSCSYNNRFSYPYYGQIQYLPPAQISLNASAAIKEPPTYESLYDTDNKLKSIVTTNGNALPVFNCLVATIPNNHENRHKLQLPNSTTTTATTANNKVCVTDDNKNVHQRPLVHSFTDDFTTMTTTTDATITKQDEQKQQHQQQQHQTLSGESSSLSTELLTSYEMALSASLDPTAVLNTPIVNEMKKNSTLKNVNNNNEKFCKLDTISLIEDDSDIEDENGHHSLKSEFQQINSLKLEIFDNSQRHSTENLSGEVKNFISNHDNNKSTTNELQNEFLPGNNKQQQHYSDEQRSCQSIELSKTKIVCSKQVTKKTENEQSNAIKLPQTSVHIADNFYNVEHVQQQTDDHEMLAAEQQLLHDHQHNDHHLYDSHSSNENEMNKSDKSTNSLSSTSNSSQENKVIRNGCVFVGGCNTSTNNNNNSSLKTLSVRNLSNSIKLLFHSQSKQFFCTFKNATTTNSQIVQNNNNLNALKCNYVQRQQQQQQQQQHCTDEGNNASKHIGFITQTTNTFGRTTPVVTPNSRNNNSAGSDNFEEICNKEDENNIKKFCDYQSVENFNVVNYKKNLVKNEEKIQEMRLNVPGATTTTTTSTTTIDSSTITSNKNDVDDSNNNNNKEKNSYKIPIVEQDKNVSISYNATTTSVTSTVFLPSKNLEKSKYVKDTGGCCTPTKTILQQNEVGAITATATTTVQPSLTIQVNQNENISLNNNHDKNNNNNRKIINSAKNIYNCGEKCSENLNENHNNNNNSNNNIIISNQSRGGVSVINCYNTTVPNFNSISTTSVTSLNSVNNNLIKNSNSCAKKDSEKINDIDDDNIISIPSGSDIINQNNRDVIRIGSNSSSSNSSSNNNLNIKNSNSSNNLDGSTSNNNYLNNETNAITIIDNNGLPPSNQRTFISTECQTDDIILDQINQKFVGQILSDINSNNNDIRNNSQTDVLTTREQRRRERRERRLNGRNNNNNNNNINNNCRPNLHPHPSTSTTTTTHLPVIQTNFPPNSNITPLTTNLIRPAMLPDILHSHFPPPYTTLSISNGHHHNHQHHHHHHPHNHHHSSNIGSLTSSQSPQILTTTNSRHTVLPSPPSQLITAPIISAVPLAATAAVVNDGRFTIPLPVIRRSPSERSGKGCCGQWFAGPPLRALIAVVALGGVACALGGAALGATSLAGPPTSHLTAALLMIGVGVILVTVSGAAWRMTAPGGPQCLGFGSTADLARCGRRPCNNRGGTSHGLLYPEFQHRPPPPSYQASMQEYRLRLLLLDRDRQNGVVRGGSPPPTYRSHAGSLLRTPLTSNVRNTGRNHVRCPGSEYSLPPSYNVVRNNNNNNGSSINSVNTVFAVQQLQQQLSGTSTTADAIVSRRNEQQHTNSGIYNNETGTDIITVPSVTTTTATTTNNENILTETSRVVHKNDDKIQYDKFNPRVLTKGNFNNNKLFINSNSNSNKKKNSSNSSQDEENGNELVTIVTISSSSSQRLDDDALIQQKPNHQQSEMQILAHL